MKPLIWALAPVLAFGLCGSPDEGSDELTDVKRSDRTVEQGEYSFSVGAHCYQEGSAADDESLKFSGTVTKWSPDTAILLLGPEKTGEPLAQLITGVLVEDAYVDFPNATMSTTDVRVGTGAEINGKLYQGGGEGCSDDPAAPTGGGRPRNLIEIGGNFLSASFVLHMVRIDQNGAGEMITVRGSFTAITS